MYENIFLAEMLSFAAIALWCIWRVFTVVRGRIRLQRKRKSFETYAETGQVDEAFDSLTGDGAEAAGRARAAVVAKRLHGRTDFVALSDCPKCSWIDVHWITARARVPADRTVTRTCRNPQCKFEWREH